MATDISKSLRYPSIFLICFLECGEDSLVLEVEAEVTLDRAVNDCVKEKRILLQRQDRRRVPQMPGEQLRHLTTVAKDHAITNKAPAGLRSTIARPYYAHIAFDPIVSFNGCYLAVQDNLNILLLLNIF